LQVASCERAPANALRCRFRLKDLYTYLESDSSQSNRIMN